MANVNNSWYYLISVIIVSPAHAGLLISDLLLMTMMMGSTSAMACPEIPSSPYIPKSPQEDIIRVEAYLEEPTSQPSPQGFVGLNVIVTVTFAASTPPTGQSLQILVTALQGLTPTETVIDCKTISGSSSTTHITDAARAKLDRELCNLQL